MARFLRIFVVLAAAFFCLAWSRTSLWAADEPSPPLADVTKVEKIEIRAVNPVSGIATIEVDLNLEGKFNATVTQVALRNFYIDKILVVAQPYTESFELKAKQGLLKEFLFEVPVTTQMSPLMTKLRHRVPVSGTAQIMGQLHGAFGFGKKIVSSDCAFSAEALLDAPDDVVVALSKIPSFGGDAVKDQPGRDGATRRDTDGGKDPISPVPEPWIPQMRQRGSNNVVIIESSAQLGFVKLYRQGYRISETEVIAPIDLQEPLKAKSRHDGVAETVATITNKLNPGDVQYRAWMGGPQGADATDRITSDAPTVPLRFKCKLPVGGGSRIDLGVFEFTNLPQNNLEKIDLDSDAGSIVPTIQLSYTGLSDEQPFSSATLTATQLSGSVAGSSYFMNPHAVAMAYGSPIFSRHGLLAIVNGEDGAVTAAEIMRAKSNSCTGPQVSLPSKPAPLPDTYSVKVWSIPAGATVWVDGKLALDESLRPITTAASKETCGAQNTVLIPKARKGPHRFSFIKEDYRPFGGTVDVDDDMTLGATLKR